MFMTKTNFAFTFFILLFFCGVANAQCSFDIQATVLQNSTCASNGILQVKLIGDQIDSLQSISVHIDGGGDIQYNTDTATTKIFYNLVPTTYIITAYVVCQDGISQGFRQTTVTILEEYQAISASGTGAQGSYLCSASGSVNINIYDGRPPYSVKIVSAPSIHSGDTVFTHNTAVALNISNLNAGNYVFLVFDECLSHFREVNVTIPSITLAASLVSVTKTVECLNNPASATINITNGQPPYTITITSSPSTYTGQTVFTRTTTGSFNINNLTSGNYTFTVTNDCSETIVIPAIINEVPNEFPTMELFNGNYARPVGSYLATSASNGLYDCYSNSYCMWGGGGYVSVARPDDYSCKEAYAYINFPINQSAEVFGYLAQHYGCHYRPQAILERCCLQYNFDYYCYQYSDYYENYYKHYCYYEVAFSVDGVKNWIPLDQLSESSPQYLDNYNNLYQELHFELPDSYRNLYNDGKKVEVYLRLKGTNCEELIGELELETPPQNTLDTRVNTPVCSNIYTWSFRVNNDLAMCSPFTWEIYNTDNNTLVASGTYSSRCSYDYKSAILNYGTNYQLIVTDSEGTQLTATRYQVRPPDPVFRISSNSYARNCGDYNWSFSITGGCAGAGAVTWTLYNADNTVNQSGTGTNGTLTLVYDRNYRFVATNGTDTVQTSVFLANEDNHSFYSYGNIDFQCSDYEFRFHAQSNVRNCYYDWEILDSAGGIVAQGVLQTTNSVYSGRFYSNHASIRLNYDEKYTIRLINSAGVIVELTNYGLDNVVKNYDFNISANGSFFDCYTQLNSLITISGALYDGTRIRFLDGPQTPVHSDATISGYFDYNEHFNLFNKRFKYYQYGSRYDYQYYYDCDYYDYWMMGSCDYCWSHLYSDTYFNFYKKYYDYDVYRNVEYCTLDENGYWYGGTEYFTGYNYNYSNNFYPFSLDYSQREYLPIADGTYRFEITDICGRMDTVSVNYVNSTINYNFTYIRDDSTKICESVSYIYPRGQIFINNVNVGTSGMTYRLVSAPSGVSVGTIIYPQYAHISSYRQYFEFSTSGRYVINLVYNNCVIDSLVITHERISFNLAARSSYLCDDGGVGHVRIEAKDGMLPYTFQLLNEDETPIPGIDPNTTGVFDITASGSMYKAKITDQCNSTVIISVPITHLDQMPLIGGLRTLCEGESLNLSCLVAGATSYEWTGVNHSSSTRNLYIESVSLSDAGNYTVVVRPDGCNTEYTETIPIVVNLAPAALEPIDTIFICWSDEQYQLPLITPESNCVIRWYDRNYELLAGATPMVNVTFGQEFKFYVEQADNVYFCGSSRTEVVIVKSPPIRTVLSGSLCVGDSILFGNTYYKNPGTYTHTLTSEQNCDSLIILNLNFSEPENRIIYRTIYDGDSILFGGIYLKTEGIYTAIESADYGCFNTELHLTVEPLCVPTSETITDTICHGETYTLNGLDYTVANTYTQTITNLAGCDSVITLHLTVNQPTSETITDTICHGETYTLNGLDYTVSNTYTQTITNLAGCDSVITLHLVVNIPTSETITDTICHGETYTLNGADYTVANTYTQTITNLAGCDSVITLHLVVNLPTSETITDTICQGENYTLYNFNLLNVQSDTVLIDSLKTDFGCDSIVTVELFVKPLPTVTVLNSEVCENENINMRFTGVAPFTLDYTFNSTRQTIIVSDYDTVLVATQTGENLFIVHSLISDNGCFGGNLTDGVIINGIIWATSNVDMPGTFAVNPEDAGMFYQWNRNIGYSATDPLINSNGTTTWDNSQPTGTTWEAANDPCPAGWRVPTINEFENIMSTGSVWTTTPVNGRILGSGSNTIFLPAASCRIPPYGWLDSTVPVPPYPPFPLGNYWSSTISNSGFGANGYHFDDIYDSVCNEPRCSSLHNGFSVRCVTENRVQKDTITVHRIYNDTIQDSICFGGNYTKYNFNLQNVQNNTVITQTLQTAGFGCDSVFTVELFVNLPTNRTINDTICLSDLPYTLYGFNVSSGGQHQRGTINSVGCDSTIILNLVVALPTASTVNATICQGETYTLNGVDYTVSNTYIQTITNLAGCDSIITLNLVVNNIVFTNVVDSMCYFEQYYFNGNVLNSAGIYVDTLTTQHGCDSIVTLDLSYYWNRVTEIYDTICSNDTYYFNGMYLTEAGIYYDTLHSVIAVYPNCATLQILHLSVKNISYSSISATICPGETYNFGDTILRTAGIYYNTAIDANGCDNITTLTLSVEYSSLVNDNLQLCIESLPYTYGDTIFDVGTQSGVYMFSNGCEYVSLDLEIVTISNLKIIAYDACADDPIFRLEIEPTSNYYTHNFTEYSIVFDNNAISAGFINQSGIINGMDIEVDIPKKIYPDYYNFTLILTNSDVACNSQTIDVRLAVLYPDSIMVQKWDNVIALKNYYYNGGFEFDAYQWFKNGFIMAGQTHSYIYIGENDSFVVGDEYSVEITRPGGSKMFSCPLVADYPRQQNSDFPIVVSDNGQIHIYIQQKDMKARLWTVDGRLFTTVDLTPPMSTIDIPWQDAVYLVEIFKENEPFKQVIPVVVKKNQIR